MAKSGRPSAITEKIGHAIAVIRDRHPDWSFHTIQRKIPDFYRSEFKSSFTGQVPSLNPIITYIREEVDPGKIKIAESGIEKIWSSASLNQEPITPEAIHFLMWVQTHRKIFDSKPLTIREAKWFNRLLGIREEFSYPPDF